MREILFRGKRKDNGEWVYGLLLETPLQEYREYGSNLYIVRGYAERSKDGWDFSSYLVDEETVGQYTGYKIDDIKVFENDISKVHLEIPYLPHQDKAIDDIGVVCFDTEDLRYYVVSNTGKKYALCYIKEIVGNIHDNSELLKGGVGNEK